MKITDKHSRMTKSSYRIWGAVKVLDVLFQSAWCLLQGAAAQGVNHTYAKDIDVLVPNLYPGSRTIVRTEEEVVSPTYLQEINFNNAYSGVSTRKVIMEERNVYCGAYNVMVLSEQ